MIEIRKLSKKYDKVEALVNISLEVKPGEIYGLLGPNGAGKSTTINIISGLIRPTSGTACVGGFDVAVNPIEAKKILGVVPQQSIVVDELSAVQNCMFFGSLYGMEKAALKKRSHELLDWAGLSGRLKEPVSRYSGGMMRRLTLVLGILHEPKALILDEPTVGLDPQTRLQILEHIEEIAEHGTAVLLSTHYLDEAERLCHRVGIIDEGRIIEEGTVGELRSKIEDVQIVDLRGSFDRRPLEEFVASAGAKIIRQTDDEMVIALSSTTGNSARLLEKTASLENVREVSIRPPSLESLFIRLTGKTIRE